MRDLGTPVYSRRLFEEVLRAFPERSQLHIVRLNGEPVAAGFTYRTPAMVQLPWASSIRDFNPLCPNVLLYWDAIQFAQATRRAGVRHGPLDAERRHVQVQGAVGRASRCRCTGNISC